MADGGGFPRAKDNEATFYVDKVSKARIIKK